MKALEGRVLRLELVRFADQDFVLGAKGWSEFILRLIPGMVKAYVGASETYAQTII